MHLERDCLEDIQQDLNAQFLELGERIEFIDLRWGICNEELNDEGKNKAVLEGCFSAIDKADYLLVFLGNRYGTLKSYDEVLGYLGRKGTDILFKEVDAEKSITELEVTYAQLIKGFDSNNTLVCIRDDQNIEEKALNFIERFTNNKAYEQSILRYNNGNSTDFRKKLKKQLSQLIEKHVAQDTEFAKDIKRLDNLAIDAILNEQMASYKIENQMVIFSGGSGIGKTTVAAEILKRNYGKKLIPFVTWEAKEKKLTYEQVLNKLAKHFSEWFKETPDKIDIKSYLKKCSSRISDSGFDFVCFLDTEENITGIKYRELLDILGTGHLFISTQNHESILSGIPAYSDYKVFDEEDILFKPDEIADIIINEFNEHGKNVRQETIDILAKKTDIIKPLYLHFAIKRLLFLKAHDYEKCTSNESPEVRVLSEIADDLPDTLNELLLYSIKNIAENSDVTQQMQMIIALLSESYKGVTEEVFIDYLLYKNVGKTKSEIMPYIYEIRNRLDDFISTDGIWYNRRFSKNVYEWIPNRNDVKVFVESRKKKYRNEYYVREYMYWNCDNAEKLFSFLSARALWKFENASVRVMYRNSFWNLVEDGFIKAETFDSSLFMKLFDLYEDTDEYFTGLICIKNPVFRLLSEKIEEEVRNYQDGDSIVFLWRIAEVYIEELRWIYSSAILTVLDDIPMDVLSIFEKLSFVYKTFAKSLINAHNSEWNLREIYKELAEETVEYSDLINSLFCAEMLIDETDNKSVTYYHNAVRLLSASDFLVCLGTYDSRFSFDKTIYNNGIYFNWRCSSYKVFDTVRYMLMYTLSKWVGSFNASDGQFAMDIVAIDYYLNYPERTDLVPKYDDALILLLTFVYEAYKLSHFRKYNESIENYWIKNYPYTKLECCSDPEAVTENDYEIRNTVIQTRDALITAVNEVYSNEVIGLKEKCTLDILGAKTFELLLKVDMPKKHRAELLIPIKGLFEKKEFITIALKNEDLHNYLPIEYMLENEEDIIRQAVKDLNFDCI